MRHSLNTVLVTCTHSGLTFLKQKLFFFFGSDYMKYPHFNVMLVFVWHDLMNKTVLVDIIFSSLSVACIFCYKVGKARCLKQINRKSF
jgi:hypothetical protein